jgi:hypothetical protein
MRRLGLIVVAAVVAVTAGDAGALLAFGDDPLEAARRRVPLGADEGAVAPAVGRPADGRRSPR